jgi:preprotein translocase subunit SecG
MDTSLILNVVEVIIAVALIIVILLQQKEGGLGSTFGGSTGGEGYRSKRGAEAVLSKATIILAILLVINTIAISAI